MKLENYIYVIAGVLIFLVSLYQFKENLGEEQLPSKISQIDDIDQLHIALNCNIYLVEGEDQHILIEGPVNRIRDVRIDRSNGCLTISGRKEAVLAGIFNFLNMDRNDINIYITLKDLDDINLSVHDETENIKYASSDVLGLILFRGQTLVIQSKFVNNCV